MKAAASIAFAAIVFILISLQRPSKFSTVKLSRSYLMVMVFLGFSLLAIAAISPWSKTLLFVYVAFLLVAALLFKDGFYISRRKLKIESLFYTGTTIVIIFETVKNYGVYGASYVSGAYDKNYFGIIVFLYFTWCWATNRKFGVLVSLFVAATIGSRNFIIMIALFFLLDLISLFLRFHSGSISDPKSGRLSPICVFAIFLSMFILITAFSFWWSDNMVGVGTTSYKGSMNDSSNAIRFNSDKYAIEHLLSNPSLFLFGYDNDIINAMGIIEAASLNGTETALDGTFFNGFRIVQPHNVILNLLLKEGVLFTAAYFGLLSFIFATYFRSDNSAYWVPYLFGCMFMHSLLCNYYLIFLLTVLARSQSSESLSSAVFRNFSEHNVEPINHSLSSLSMQNRERFNE